MEKTIHETQDLTVPNCLWVNFRPLKTYNILDLNNSKNNPNYHNYVDEFSIFELNRIQPLTPTSIHSTKERTHIVGKCLVLRLRSCSLG